MSTTILFEHPLNEKMRTWLRIEFLFAHLQEISSFTRIVEALTFFRTLNELLDIFERVDLRCELLMELAKQQLKIEQWCSMPVVDHERAQQLKQQLKQHVSILISAPRAVKKLRQDRLISSVRQRMNIPGGCCSFDLPSLYLWLSQPKTARDELISDWTLALSPLRDALTLALDIIRQSGPFYQRISVNGFYQDNAAESNMLRLKVCTEDLLYPQISGHKGRFSIRFFPLDSDKIEVPERINFHLARC